MFGKNVFLGVFVLLFSACSVTKHVPENQSLLYEQKISGFKNVTEDELIVFYRQKPNIRILYSPLMPYLMAYYKGLPAYQKKLPIWKKKLEESQVYYDSLLSAKNLTDKKRTRLEQAKSKVRSSLETKIKEGNWLMRSVGEPPTIFKADLMNTTAAQMQLFLQKEGFWEAYVKTVWTTKNKRTTVTYEITENKPHLISKTILESPDSVVRKILEEDQGNSLIKVGSRYSESKLTAERDRIAKHLKNNGFLDFSKEYIYFDIDTLKNKTDTIRGQKLDIRTFIALPTDSKQHKRLKVNEVYLITDIQNRAKYLQKKEKDSTRHRHPNKRDTVCVEQIYHIQYQQHYSRKILNSKVMIKPYMWYSQQATQETQHFLASMNIFKFVNVQYDTARNKLRANILATALPKFDFAFEGGLNVSQSLPGPFFSLGWKNRNFFGVGDVLDISTRFGIEAQAGISSSNLGGVYQSQEFSLNATLSLPFLMFPMSKQRREKIGIFDTRTKISTLAIYTNRPEYARSSVQAGFAYDWNNGQHTTFTLNLLNLGVINTSRLNDDFLEFMIDQGNNTLLQSFTRTLVSNTSLSFTYNKAQGKRSSVYLNSTLEGGGTYLNFLPKSFFENNTTIAGLKYFQYFRLQTDFRYYLHPSATTTWAGRIMGGIAKPYGRNNLSNNVLPYEKHFFSGGSNSLRAWRPRRLGPGSSLPQINDQGEFDYRFEQPGQLILEANLEYRAKLFSFVNWAWFVDAGNIWMLSPDIRRGAQFDPKTFLSEIAVGTGIGLRFDFTFIIMRFDLATRLVDPALPQGKRFVPAQYSFSEFWNRRGQTALNVGIGYPF